MAEPTSALAGASAVGVLAAIETLTGLSLPLVIWGAVGGLWAFRYLPPMRLIERVGALLIAALVSAISAQPVAAVGVAAAVHFLPWWPPAAAAAILAKPVAAIIGLLCHRVIGRRLIEISERITGGSQQ